MLNHRLIAALLACLLLATAGCSRNTPESIASQYWQSVLSGDQARAQQLVDDTETAQLGGMIEPGSGSTVEFGEAVIEGDEARVETRLQWRDDSNGGDTALFQFDTELRKTERGEWKIASDATRQAFMDSVYRTTLTGLEAALEQSLRSVRDLTGSVARDMERELNEASEEMRRQAEAADREIREFIEQLDQTLSEELQRREQQAPAPSPPKP